MSYCLMQNDYSANTENKMPAANLASLYKNSVKVLENM